MDALTPPHLSFFVGASASLVALALARGNSAYFLLVMPGTLAHELAHFLVALETLGRPQGLTLWPRKTGPDCWTLGTVEFRAGWLNGGLVGLAPLYLLPLCAWGLWQVSAQAPLPVAAMLGYLAAVTLRCAWPSSTDWLLCLKHPGLFIVALGAATGAGLLQD